MSTDVTSERRARMFPRLTETQLARIAAVGTRRAVKVGEVVFEAGDRNSAFFVVAEGALEILRLSGRRSLVRARVVEDGALIELDREHLRVLVQRDFELSEILLRAFILRRIELVSEGKSELVLVGSRHSASTMALRTFLTRNAQPFTYDDVETDPAV